MPGLAPVGLLRVAATDTARRRARARCLTRGALGRTVPAWPHRASPRAAPPCSGLRGPYALRARAVGPHRAGLRGRRDLPAGPRRSHGCHRRGGARRPGAAQLAGPVADLWQARSTLARTRRGSAGVHGVRAPQGYAATDPGLLLGTAKGHRTLPPVLRSHEVGRLLEAGPDEGPLALRDDAMLELLYATGVRVGELLRPGPGRPRPAPAGWCGCWARGQGAVGTVRDPRGSCAGRVADQGRPEVAGSNSRCCGVPGCTRRADRPTCRSSDGSRSVG